jgi:hypothetical protein
MVIGTNLLKLYPSRLPNSARIISTNFTSKTGKKTRVGLNVFSQLMQCCSQMSSFAGIGSGNVILLGIP